jgi:hypothetical protein
MSIRHCLSLPPFFPFHLPGPFMQSPGSPTCEYPSLTIVFPPLLVEMLYLVIILMIVASKQKQIQTYKQLVSLNPVLPMYVSIHVLTLLPWEIVLPSMYTLPAAPSLSPPFSVPTSPKCQPRCTPFTEVRVCSHRWSCC